MYICHIQQLVSITSPITATFTSAKQSRANRTTILFSQNNLKFESMAGICLNWLNQNNDPTTATVQKEQSVLSGRPESASPQMSHYR